MTVRPALLEQLAAFLSVVGALPFLRAWVPLNVKSPPETIALTAPLTFDLWPDHDLSDGSLTVLRPIGRARTPRRLNDPLLAVGCPSRGDVGCGPWDPRDLRSDIADNCSTSLECRKEDR